MLAAVCRASVLCLGVITFTLPATAAPKKAAEAPKAEAPKTEKWITTWAASVQGPYPIGNPSAQPVLSSIITLPSGSYPASGFIRDYAFAANFVPVPIPAPEPSSWCLLGLGLGVLRQSRRRRGTECPC
jgi:hypothetical protein